VNERTVILPPGSPGNGHDANYRLTLMVPKRRFMSYLRERWWVVLVCLACSLGAVLIYETIRSPSYRAFAQLYVSSDALVSPTGFPTEESQNYFGTQIEMLKSPRLQNAVYEKLAIHSKPGQKSVVDITVTQPMRTSLLNVEATGSDPELVQRFLQTLIAEYLAYKKETRMASSQDLLISITAEVARKSEELDAEQEKWAEFQKTNNVAVLEEDAKSAGMYLSDRNLELAKIRMERKLLSEVSNPGAAAPVASRTNGSVAARTNLSVASGTNGSVGSSLTPPVLGTAVTNELSKDDDASLKSDRLELALLLGDKEEKVRAMGQDNFDKEVARLQRLIALQQNDQQARKELEMQDLDKRIAAITNEIPIWEAKILDINQRLAQAQRIKSSIERQQGFYDHLLGTMQNVDLNKNVQQERLSVLQAPTGASPENRSLPLRIALAFAGGLALSLGIVFLWYLLDDRLVSVRDIHDQFGEPVLGLVPQIRVPRSNSEKALLETTDSRTAFSESFRHLRSALLLSTAGSTPRSQTLLFTSALPGEGKTTVAANVARVLAKSGLRVALVNADLHSAGSSNLFGAPDGRGLVNFLQGEVEMEAILHPSEIPGLTIIPNGGTNGEMEGLFLRSQLEELLRHLREKADFVILDGAPVLTVDDSSLLVPHADSVVLVTRPFHTRSRLIRQALDMLYQRRAKQVTIILNRARAEDLAGYYAENGVSARG
jgi:capsular exopolysaccharide synthesis family protein